mmetsp:Transcript_88388/g.249043  ORF Transcript_88388/g.249043 Transcript_88388/m.249043 type:complete len:94 (-) Transcript_88388:913-1194(-)
MPNPSPANTKRPARKNTRSEDAATEPASQANTSNAAVEMALSVAIMDNFPDGEAEVKSIPATNTEDATPTLKAGDNSIARLWLSNPVWECMSK